MGLDQTVKFPAGAAPHWEAVNRLLAERGFPVQLRMIDGQLSFPDEKPPLEWQELRVGTAAGMVTLRRAPDQVACVIWGNADPALRQAWNALVWAWAVVGAGRIVGPDQSLWADEYLATAELPPCLRASSPD